MLQIDTVPYRYCDGITRRGFIRAGFLGAVSLSLADWLRAQPSQEPSRRPTSSRSVILIWQHGGPSQLDTFDMKPMAPAEYRGPYKPMATSVPGIQISEKMPYHARVMDRVAILRGLTHDNGDHWAAAHWLLTGHLGSTASDRQPRNPSVGAVSSYLLGPSRRGAPAGVNFNDGGFGFHGAASLGVAHNPVRVGEFSYGNEAGRLTTVEESSFRLIPSLREEQVRDRLALRARFDAVRRDIDSTGAFDALDRINQQAVDILLSGRTRDALDVSREPAKVRDWYGPGWGEQALMARRLIEAGVRFVTLNTGYWDDHGNIKGALDDKLPRHDRAVGVLIADLTARGLLDDTLVVAAGEFGRTPRINKDAGRDHWPQAQSFLVTGGGYRGGQIIGGTNDKAEYPTAGALSPADFCAIIYHALGLTPEHTITDASGRPNHLLPGGTVPKELL
jgi:hypothetical protein